MPSHIAEIYDPILLKKLFAHALSIDIDSNNDKVDIIKHLLGPEFAELGPGTNRYAVMGPDGYCHKIALDRRGIVDNCTEFKRAQGIEWCSPKVYECNGLVLIAEAVTPLTRDQFSMARNYIISICSELSQGFIFEDIGWTPKNFCNWGIRRNNDLVILDTGYLIPRLGNEEAMCCPICGTPLSYNSTFTKFICPEGRCGTHFTFIDIYRRLTSRVDDELYATMSGYELPDFEAFNDALYNSGIMKGGHIYYDEQEHDATYYGHDRGAEILRLEDIENILS